MYMLYIHRWSECIFQNIRGTSWGNKNSSWQSAINRIEAISNDKSQIYSVSKMKLQPTLEKQKFLSWPKPTKTLVRSDIVLIPPPASPKRARVIAVTSGLYTTGILKEYFYIYASHWCPVASNFTDDKTCTKACTRQREQYLIQVVLETFFYGPLQTGIQYCGLDNT